MDVKELNLSKNLNRHPWELARARVIGKISQPYLNSHSAIVDIGCGDLFIYNQNFQGKNEIDYYAIDNALSEDQIYYYSNKYSNSSLHILKEIETLNQSLKKKVSIVYILDVLEHIEDDKDFLRRIVENSIFDSNTIFVITVPSFQSLYGPHDKILGHKRRYSNKALRKLTESLDLKTLNSGYFFLSLLLPRYFYSVASKLYYREDHSGIIKWNGNNFITKILSQFLVTDFEITLQLKKLKINCTGLSNFIICRKSV